MKSDTLERLPEYDITLLPTLKDCSDHKNLEASDLFTLFVSADAACPDNLGSQRIVSKDADVLSGIVRLL